MEGIISDKYNLPGAKGADMKNKILSLLFLLILVSGTIIGCSNPNKIEEKNASGQTRIVKVEKDGKYSKPEEVAEYIHKYQKLPANYLTKKEAIALGWESNKGNLWKVTDRMSIGGDVFGNREGKLPRASGRKWYECDVNYYGGFRGGERLIYSNDKLIYYTKDHYQTFVEFSFGKR